jgi:hypothetical protein
MESFTDKVVHYQFPFPNIPFFAIYGDVPAIQVYVLHPYIGM